MPDIKRPREANPVRPRPRPPANERSPEDFGKDILDETPVQASADGPPAPARAAEHIGSDEEPNSRYQEIKRGTTFISELQSMTIPQLLKTAKDEGIAEYTVLKKQDLIFKILKERVKQNGLMLGQGTLEVLLLEPGVLGDPFVLGGLE